MIGFCAQLIDGALGMAYGVTSTTALMATGMPPALASANVHAAEIVTTAISGGSHAAAGNVDWHLLFRLAPVGAIGALVGALIGSRLDLALARPMIAAYLLSMGILILWKAIHRRSQKQASEKVSALGFVGGFCDALGGGGWGPVVASNLIARGGDVSKTIGTVNAAEFFMTTAATIGFLSAFGLEFGTAAFGLLVGGAAAAPIAAVAVKHTPKSALTVIVGFVICLLSLYNLVDWFWRGY